MVLRRAFPLLIVLAVFLLGLFRDVAMEVDALHRHVVCPEHGELLHTAAGAGQERGEQQEWRAVAPDEHGDGCVLADLGLAPGGLAEPFPEFVPPEAPPIIATGSAPRAPPAASPLRFAPKTSPPRLS